MQITFDHSDLFIAWLNGLDEWSASDAILIHVLSDMNMMMIHDCHYLWGKAVILSSQCFLSYCIFWRIVPVNIFSYFFEFPMSSNVKFSPCGLVSSSEKSLMIMFERTEIWMVPVVVAWIIIGLQWHHMWKTTVVEYEGFSNSLRLPIDSQIWDMTILRPHLFCGCSYFLFLRLLSSLSETSIYNWHRGIVSIYGQIKDDWL